MIRKLNYYVNTKTKIGVKRNNVSKIRTKLIFFNGEVL